MKQVVQNVRSGSLTVRNVPAPTVRARHVLVRTHASLISAGTERMVTDFAQKSLAGKAKDRPDLVKKVIDKAKRDGIGATIRSVTARLNEPLPLGYSAAGVVEAVGAGLEGVFHVGQSVAIAGAGIANHAELNVVPENLCAAIPEGVAHTDACYATVAAIALHAARNAQTGLGDVVAVFGAGLVGQLAARFLSIAGARVIILDPDTSRRDLAMDLGAEWGFNPFDATCADQVRACTNGLGADALVIAAATDSAQPLEAAAEMARDRARVVMVGMTGTAFPYAAFMKKELSIIVSRSYGPGRYDDDFEKRGVKYPVGWVRWTETENMVEALRQMSRPDGLNISKLTTHSFDLNAAEQAYALIKERSEPSLGIVLTYPDSATSTLTLLKPAGSNRVPADSCALGVIGAGAYATSVLLPGLKSISGVRFQTIAAPKGANADAAKETFGFQSASTEADTVLSDPSVNAVLIATRHSSHADLTARALAAGKSVWVEKPLSLDAEGIDAVEAAMASSDAFFTVGFNRRFAPTAQKLRTALAASGQAAVVSMRINAGPLPRDHWTQSPEDGGGRIIGEACHFIDLARFLVGSPITTVTAEAASATDGPCDDVSIQMRFANGGLATVVYTARGGSGLAKERIEAFTGGGAWVIDDFKTITGPGVKASKTASTDKGQKALLKAFVSAVRSGGAPPIPEMELIETSRATLAVMESLRTGGPIHSR